MVQSGSGEIINDIQFYVTEKAIATVLLYIKGTQCDDDGSSWKPEFTLINDSEAEKKAIRDTFSELSAGEQKITILVCTWYMSRVFMRRLRSYYNGKVLEEMNRKNFMSGIYNLQLE